MDPTVLSFHGDNTLADGSNTCGLCRLANIRKAVTNEQQHLCDTQACHVASGETAEM